MRDLQRSKAIQQICKQRLESLTHEARHAHLCDWWNGPKENQGRFTESLQKELSGPPPEDVASTHYDPVVLLGLAMEYVGVSNTFLEGEILGLEGSHINVCGEVESLEPCPCCTYKTLPRRGGNDECPLCLWLDDGNDDLAYYSGPNHKLLSEGRAKFNMMKAFLPLNKWLPGPLQATD